MQYSIRVIKALVTRMYDHDVEIDQSDAIMKAEKKFKSME